MTHYLQAGGWLGVGLGVLALMLLVLHFEKRYGAGGAIGGFMIGLVLLFPIWLVSLFAWPLMLMVVVVLIARSLLEACMIKAQETLDRQSDRERPIATHTRSLAPARSPYRA
jgi:uncharacterized membrane protein